MDAERYELEDKEGRLKMYEEAFAEQGLKMSKFTNYRLMADFEVP